MISRARAMRSGILQPLPREGSPECEKDTCCIWQYISDDMRAAFAGESGRCTALARGAVRLGFHDAAGWSKATGPLGGADGSIILAPIEMTRRDNRGLEEIVAQMKVWYRRYGAYGVSMADLIQMGATVATVVCPLGPRIKSYVGRRDSAAPAPDGLLPGVNQPAGELIALFRNKTIEPHGLTALIGAHTTSQQRFVDPERALDPQDSTPGVWDVLFYKQTLGSAPPRVFRFQSDIVLAQDPRISREFQEFAGPGGQRALERGEIIDYSALSAETMTHRIALGLRARIRPSQPARCLTISTASRTVPRSSPPRRRSWKSPDKPELDKWLGTDERLDPVSAAIEAGKSVAGLADVIDDLVESVGAVAKSSPLGG